LTSRANRQADSSAPSAAGVRTLVVGPYPSDRAAAKRSSGAPGGRSPEARLAEAEGLAAAIEVDVIAAELVALARITPATYLGSGKVRELAERIKSEDIELVIMDCALSPVQQRNLEKAFTAKVIDRTGLILEIFGRRARTREGALQVELAHLAYQKSRLVRSWTHLERQRGGFGFLGGPGETQIETDRRLIQERMVRIERELEGVKKTRGLHRKVRSDAPFPTVALVGYTNAGKSSLFNRLSGAQVAAKDLLFATLDPTLRGVRLPHGAKIMLSDTVGFISDLPTSLVTSFRATLEEVLVADVVLHVRDLAHEDAEAQSADVEAILTELGIDPSDHQRLMEVWNKVDLLDEDARASLENTARRRRGADRPVLVSALTGEGLEFLLQGLEDRLAAGHPTMRILLAPEDGAGLNWIYETLEVLDRSSEPDGSIRLAVRAPQDQVGRILRRFPDAVLEAKSARRSRRAAG